MVHCTKNEFGEWVVLASDGKATWYRLGWISYEKQKEACKNCPSGPWSLGAVSCADICQRAVVYIVEKKLYEPAILYSAKINDLGKAIPDKQIAVGREAWEYLAKQGIPPVYF